eukprot:TRINITY_DN1102_c0_g1_i4.p2 TRINITY_DN1102_c0_g1~~TRINITY_DN1102_c0_g1_i4.p2  ORF type:complete len:374 (-),score=50.80 TRINITY_DN1102_c0_g1_i4:3388-4509(-)
MPCDNQMNMLPAAINTVAPMSPIMPISPANAYSQPVRSPNSMLYPVPFAPSGNPNQMVPGVFPTDPNMYKAAYDTQDYFASSPTGYMSNFAPLYPKSDLLVNKGMGAMYGFPPQVSIPFPLPLRQFQVTNRPGVVSDKMMGSLGVNLVKATINPKRVQQQQQLSANKDRTIFVSEIDYNVTEEDLACLFSRCGEVVDCRLCGDAHSRMRFAFIEFSKDSWKVATPEALKLNNTVMKGIPIRVLRSKTAIIPVKRELLPRSGTEMERCQRTIYVSNIDRRLTEKDVQSFFETLSVDSLTGADGKISKIRLLGDNSQNTSIAFVEFVTPESAIAALDKCQGALMGCLPLRVSPSKTPVRTQEEERNLRSGRPRSF